jgi:DNA polymerase I-like protein with 3'-5' exonuclease and polymerase domains
LTPDQAERLALIRAALPPIHDRPPVPFNGPAYIQWDSLVCVDLEWHRESNCSCGVPTREVGLLETVGIGNEKSIVQIDWQASEFDWDWMREWFMAVIATVPVVFQNADGDIRKLRANGFPIWAESFKQLDDTMLAHAVLESELPHGLEFLTLEHGHLPQHKDLAKVAPVEYNAADVLATVLIWKHYLLPYLESDPQAEQIYRRLSLPFVWLAIESEEAGIRVNPTLPPVLYAELDIKRKQATRLLQAYAGWPVNINSPDQMKHLLYNIEGLPLQFEKGSRVEDQKVTTDKDAIAALRRSFGTEWEADVAPTLESAWANIEAGGHVALEARYLFMSAQQQISHYIQPCLSTERIYPDCSVHAQASGRVGYVRPALPQMKDRLLDQLWPDEGSVWIGHDWRQIEVRLLAVLANDRVYLDAFDRGDDIHGLNTRAIFGPPGSPELEAIRRRWVKAFAFRLHYRGKPENAGDIPGTRGLGLDVPALIVASEKYLAAHPALSEYWRGIEWEADHGGVVRTFMGRPRRLTGQSRNARNRAASNHPMQGGVADIFLETALLVKKAAPWARLVFGAYDSHWWSMPLAREMEFLGLYVPIVEREFTIGAERVSFPADYKRKVAA